MNTFDLNQFKLAWMPLKYHMCYNQISGCCNQTGNHRWKTPPITHKIDPIIKCSIYKDKKCVVIFTWSISRMRFCNHAAQQCQRIKYFQMLRIMFRCLQKIDANNKSEAIEFFNGSLCSVFTSKAWPKGNSPHQRLNRQVKTVVFSNQCYNFYHHCCYRYGIH